ncbi:EAL domain protein [Bacillus sp. ZZV12-4809]|nr:EAL domain protein [Bacillus sp. ZZV12-4809]
MSCNACVVQELQFEVRTDGEQISRMFSNVVEHLERKGVLVEAESVSFRSFDEAWRPIEEVAEILDSLWIDEVIAYEMLARFYREDGSVIFPGEIFSAARKRSRLYALDRLCRMTAVRFASFIDKKAFINFIPTSIYSPEFCLKSTVQLANRLGV